MKRLHRLKKNEEFQEVFKKGKSFTDSNLVLYSIPTNGDEPFRIGISVGKKIGKAIVRNRCKRLIREAVRLNANHIPAGVNIVLIARHGILKSDFFGIQKSFIKLLKKASLWTDDNMI